MAETKHTPGPWHRVKYLASPYWTLGTIREHVAKPLPKENEDADWTLAEAAPDLLEALERVRACEKCGEDYGRCMACDRLLDGVIAKARPTPKGQVEVEVVAVPGKEA